MPVESDSQNVVRVAKETLVWDRVKVELQGVRWHRRRMMQRERRWVEIRQVFRTLWEDGGEKVDRLYYAFEEVKQEVC